MFSGTRITQTRHEARARYGIGLFTSSGSDFRVTETSLDDLNEVTRGALCESVLGENVDRLNGESHGGKRTGKLTDHAAGMRSPAPQAPMSAKMPADVRLKHASTINFTGIDCENVVAYRRPPS